MKKIFCYLLIAALVLGTFTGCKKQDASSTESTGASQAENTEGKQTQSTETKNTETAQTETTETTANIAKEVTQPDTQTQLYAAEPYVDFSVDFDSSKLDKIDWESILNQIPYTRYEEYPKATEILGIPLTATLYKDGKAITVDVNDPRLIRLLNFYNNTIYHKNYSLYSYTPHTHGSYIPDTPSTTEELETLIGKTPRLELTYAPVQEDAETLFDTVIVDTNHFMGIQNDVYPVTIEGRFPLSAQSDWLTVFGF